MRIPSMVYSVARYMAALVVIAGSVLLMSAPKNPGFSAYDKAYYADSNTVNFVRPGLVIRVVSANVATDGTITARYKITDPRGLALDRDGIQTPGAVAVTLIAAYIPKSGGPYIPYTTRSQGPSPITGATAIQGSGDAGGVHKLIGDGEYEYTFATKAVPLTGALDRTATHTIGAYGSRNLTEFDLGTNYASGVLDFVPDGSKVVQTRDVIKTSSCNKCHDSLGFHGGSRRGIEVCVLCHTPTTAKGNTNIDPDTGNTIDMPVMIHKIHAGEELPSVQKGKPYQIVGNGQRVSDWSSVVMPSGASNCQFCHEQNTNAAQKDAYLKGSRAACGACHDNVNFATGENHANLAQVSDNQCTTCHIPKGELENDVSILGAHLQERDSVQNPGLIFNITKVENGSAGKKPTVTFTLKNNKGEGIPLAAVTTGNARNRIALTLAGPTSDYGYTNFGSDVTTAGYVTEDPTTGADAAKCSNDGTCTFTMRHAIPADAKGTYTVMIDGRLDIKVNPGTKKEAMVEFSGTGKQVAFNFSVDGSPIEPRRKIVDIAKCNSCHAFLTLHGENRNQIEQCVICHNPGETDKSRRPSAPAAEKAKPNQSINMALMIHKIHTGERMAEFGTNYTVIGFGGSVNDFSEVRYPAMTPTGGVADTAKCYMCHVNGSEAVFPIGRQQVTDPQGRYLQLVASTTSACTACHQSKSALAHSKAQTDDKFGESCDVCHAVGADFDVIKGHAGK
jgi:OmcA/MtrC family decaheme c-type cytochrome